MWQLIKTEIQYYKWLYIMSLIFVIIVNIGLTIDNRWIESQGDFPGLRIIWIGIGIVVFFFHLLSNRKSGRLRTQTLLPLSNREQALVRIVPFLLFWLILSFVLQFFYLINNSTFLKSDWIFNLVGLTGIMLLINSIPVLNTDFYSTFFSKRSKFILGISWAILWITYIELNMIFSTYLDFISPEFFEGSRELLESYYSSHIGITINFLIGVIAFFTSLLTFKKRLLYLE